MSTSTRRRTALAAWRGAAGVSVRVEAAEVRGDRAEVILDFAERGTATSSTASNETAAGSKPSPERPDDRLGRPRTGPLAIALKLPARGRPCADQRRSRAGRPGGREFTTERAPWHFARERLVTHGRHGLLQVRRTAGALERKGDDGRLRSGGVVPAQDSADEYAGAGVGRRLQVSRLRLIVLRARLLAGVAEP